MDEGMKANGTRVWYRCVPCPSLWALLKPSSFVTIDWMHDAVCAEYRCLQSEAEQLDQGVGASSKTAA